MEIKWTREDVSAPSGGVTNVDRVLLDDLVVEKDAMGYVLWTKAGKRIVIEIVQANVIRVVVGK